jgi:hypothetical protein
MLVCAATGGFLRKSESVVALLSFVLWFAEVGCGLLWFAVGVELFGWGWAVCFQFANKLDYLPIHSISFQFCQPLCIANAELLRHEHKAANEQW